MLTVDSTVLITAAADSTVRLWNVETGVELQKINFKSPLRSVEIAEGDRQFLAVNDNVMGQTTTVSIFSLNEDGKGKERINVLRLVSNVVIAAGNPHEIPIKEAKVNQAMWGPLNRTIITAGDDGVIRVYDAETRKQVILSGGRCTAGLCLIDCVGTRKQGTLTGHQQYVVR